MASIADPGSEPKLEMSARAREYFEKSFLVRYRELQREVESTPLVVLIWGPGAGGGDLYQKRMQIRDELMTQGYAAVFSEDIDTQCGDLNMSSKARELLQAYAADFIVIIHSSPGAIAETHDFAGFLQDLGRKLLVFIDSRHVDGYSYTGALFELRAAYNNVRTYVYPEDISQCHLLSSVESRLHVLRWAKWRGTLS